MLIPGCGPPRPDVLGIRRASWSRGLILFNLVESAGWYGQNAPGEGRCVPLLYYPPEEAGSPTHAHSSVFAVCNLLGSPRARPSSAGRREQSLGASNWTLELIGELD